LPQTFAADSAQVSPQENAQLLLSMMTPEEKVGQLLLITFRGTDAGQDSIIHDLIVNRHVGGVLLKRENDNFVGPENTVQAAWELIRQLQTTEWEASLTQEINPDSNSVSSPNYIPLFVAISQEGDGYPYSEILYGLTQLPNQMTLGATWNPNLAQQVGGIVGKELSSLGINLLLGPSLDILEDPNPDDTGNLGTRTFGGDPFWVGEFAKAYISGVHQGSSPRMAVIGKYFPGRGSSDRPPEEEVATIRKTLEQLKQTDLAPFFTVTGDAPSPDATIDGLLTSHIKYQGFQSNIRSTTRPISFDPQAFDQLMSLPAFEVWRENGGIMVSDELGTRAVRLFFSPTGEVFNAHFVARDALLAGNDLLNLGNLVGSDDSDPYATILRILDFFAVKYREDPAFAQRVDEAALRILTKKFEIYGSFTLENIVPAEEGLQEVGTSQELIFDISRQAATLISPPASELDNVLPNPPGLQDQIVFITDAYTVKQCSVCEEATVLGMNTLQDIVLRLYGPESGGQTTRRNLLSFSFEHLQSMLDRGINRTEIEFHIKNAEWLVIAMLDVRQQRPLSIAVKRFLNERPDLLRGKNVIIFAFNAPYYLDATDISKLTAYYALYSKTPQSVEVAARLLFNEIRPLTGALPVSVTGINYDLFEATTPNPQQTIELFLGSSPSQATPAPEETTPSPPPSFQAGDLIPIQTGIILDHNNKPVPDGTEVRLILSTVGERSVVLKEIIATTTGGIARATFPIETQGNMVITARSEPATLSTAIPITVEGERPTPTNSPTAEATTTPEVTTPVTPVIFVGSVIDDNPGNVSRFMEWLLAVLIAFLVSWGAYRASVLLGQVRWSLRIAFCVLIGGLLGYIYIATSLPGADWFLSFGGAIASGVGTILGNGLGLLAALLWKRNGV
jgi:beta-N-acetylhexosaminidase